MDMAPKVAALTLPDTLLRDHVYLAAFVYSPAWSHNPSGSSWGEALLLCRTHGLRVRQAALAGDAGELLGTGLCGHPRLSAEM